MSQAGLCSNVACGRLKEVSSQHLLIAEEDNPNKLTLVLEPEAAALFCQTMSQRACAQYCTAEEPFNSDSYLVVDIGGGTVDTVAYQIKGDGDTVLPHIRIIHEPNGEPCGGSGVNEEFKKFLEKLTGDPGFSRYVQTDSHETNAKHQAYLDKIFNEQFECQKTIFGNKQLDEDGKVSITLNSSFIKCYGTQIEEHVQEINTTEEKPYTRFSSETDELRISYSKLKNLFNPVVEGIIQCVANVLNNVPNVHTIYLVGGFGGCEYIHSELKSHFKGNFKFITPREKEHAVVRGAAMIRRNPEFIKARVIDATYGVRVQIPFVRGLHDEEYRCRVPGKQDVCSDIFATFVEKGDVVTPNHVYMKTFYPEREDQKSMRVQIYSSKEKDVWYTTGKPSVNATDSGLWLNVRKIGELKVPFRKRRGDETECADQSVNVMFDFSTAEIIVTGSYNGSDTPLRLVLDFFG